MTTAADLQNTKARERIIRNLTNPAHPWTRQLSTLFGVNPEVALAALCDLAGAGMVAERLTGRGHEYRRV